MLLPFDGSKPPQQAAATTTTTTTTTTAFANPTTTTQQQQKPTFMHVALELTYTLMRNLLTAGSRDEVAVLFYGLAPAKAAAAADAAGPSSAAAPAPPQPTSTSAFEGVVPLQPLCVPGADAMRRLRDLRRGDRARFEEQVGARFWDEQGGEEEAEGGSAANATTTKTALRSGDALRMALWAARDTLRQQGGAGGGGGRRRAGGAAAVAATAPSSSGVARRVLLLSAAEDPTAAAAGPAAAATTDHPSTTTTPHDEAALLRVREQVFERAGELGALGASLEVVPLGALRAAGDDDDDDSHTTAGINMELFWNPLVRCALDATESVAARGVGSGGGGATEDATDADPLLSATVVDGVVATSAAFPPLYTLGRVQERLETLLLHFLRPVHRRRPLARSALVLPCLVGGGDGEGAATSNDASSPATPAALTIPVAVYSLVARPSVRRPAVLVTARDCEPLRVSTAWQCDDTGATLGGVTHRAMRVGVVAGGGAGAGGGAYAPFLQRHQADHQSASALRYPDSVVFTSREAAAMRSAGPARDSLWRGDGAATTTADLGGDDSGRLAMVAAAASADDNDDEEDDEHQAPTTQNTQATNPAAWSPGCYVYLGSKPLSELSDAHQLTAPVFLYPDEKQGQGRQQRPSSSSSSSSPSITAAFTALHRALLDTRRFAVCRSGRRSAGGAGGGLGLTALVPQEEKVCSRTGRQLQPPGFHAIALPYREDLRHPELQPLPGLDKALKRAAGVVAVGGGGGGGDASAAAAAPYYASEKQVRAAEALISRLMFGAGDNDDQDPSSHPPPFYPPLALNPVLERHRQLVEAAALGERPRPLVWSDPAHEKAAQARLKAEAEIDGGRGLGGGGEVEPPASRRRLEAEADDDDDDENAAYQQQLMLVDAEPGALATTSTATTTIPPPLPVHDLDATLPDAQLIDERAGDVLAAFCDSCGIGREGRQLAKAQAAANQGVQGIRNQRAATLREKDPLAVAVLESVDWLELARETAGVGGMSIGVVEAEEAGGGGGSSGGGGLNRLTIDQLKTYLRAHALKLTGTKPVLVQTVREHALKKAAEEEAAGGGGGGGVGALAGAAAAVGLLPAAPSGRQQQQKQPPKRGRAPRYEEEEEEDMFF
jgi:hypothetical protein